jgi:hypothetical protein
MDRKSPLAKQKRGLFSFPVVPIVPWGISGLFTNPRHFSVSIAVVFGHLGPFMAYCVLLAWNLNLRSWLESDRYVLFD